MTDVVIQGDATSALVGVTKRTLDRLLDSEASDASRAQIIALYLFYCYTAKWQRTEQIKCTNSFAAQRLQLSTRTIARTRAVLERMELVRSVCVRSAGGKVEAWYVRVNHIQNAVDGTLVQNAKPPECHPCPTNASDTDTSTKCLKTNRRRARLTDEEFLSALKANPAYAHIDFDRELAKMDAWLISPKGHGRSKTRQFILNWLNKADAALLPNRNGKHQTLTTESSRNIGTSNEGKSSQYRGIGKVRGVPNAERAGA